MTVAKCSFPKTKLKQKGETIVKNVEAQGSGSGAPKGKVTIIDSGELK